jgi:DNA-directed RNA polymerase specialized sigma24 family protein
MRAYRGVSPPQEPRKRYQSRDASTVPGYTMRVKMPQSRRQSAYRVERGSSVIVPFPVPRSEVGLVTALRAGHSDAVFVLCERHSGYLLRLAARILGPDEFLVPVVADAVQRSLGMLDQLKDPHAFRAWLLSQLVVAARHRLRGRRRWRWLIPRKFSDPSPEGKFYSDRLMATYRVLDRLDDYPRIVFCLAVIDSMSLTEVAAALGITLADVRVTLDRACKSFARCCESEPLVLARTLRSA